MCQVADLSRGSERHVKLSRLAYLLLGSLLPRCLFVRG